MRRTDSCQGRHHPITPMNNQIRQAVDTGAMKPELGDALDFSNRRLSISVVEGLEAQSKLSQESICLAGFQCITNTLRLPQSMSLVSLGHTKGRDSEDSQGRAGARLRATFQGRSSLPRQLQ